MARTTLQRWGVAVAVAVALGACGSGGEESGTSAAGDGGDGSAAAAALTPPGSGTSTLDGDLHPGEYHTERFDPNFSFTIREDRDAEFGWRGDISRKRNAEIAEGYGLDPAKFTGDTRWSIVAEIAGAPYFEFIRLVDPERQATSWGVSFIKEVFEEPVEALVDELRAIEGLKAESPTPASVGGSDGLQFDSVVTAKGALHPDVISSDLSYAEGQQVRFIVVDVSGSTKVITIEAPTDEFGEFLSEAEEFLSTVQWWPQA